jgi:hypothetical protein
VRSGVALDLHGGARCLSTFDPVEDRPGGLVLQDAPVLNAAGPQGFSKHQPSERRLIRGSDLAPQTDSLGAQSLPIRRIARGESHPSLSESRAGDQRLAVESSGYQLQFVGGGAGFGEVSSSDLDLDLRLEQRRPLQVRIRWQLLGGHAQGVLERVSNGGRCRGHVALGKTHQRETGLRVPPGAMSGQKRLFGAFDVSLAKSDPPELAQGPAHLAS